MSADDMTTDDMTYDMMHRGVLSPQSSVCVGGSIECWCDEWFTVHRYKSYAYMTCAMSCMQVTTYERGCGDWFLPSLGR